MNYSNILFVNHVIYADIEYSIIYLPPKRPALICIRRLVWQLPFLHDAKPSWEKLHGYRSFSDAVLVLIHVGEVQPDEKAYMEEMIETTGVNRDKVKIMWEKGNPARKIISVAKKEKIDLLIAGALQRENVVKFYFGSIARKLIRKSVCSLLMLINPSQPGKSFQAHCNQRNGRR
jgi:nucleotide-binding universal stress UspA family protein